MQRKSNQDKFLLPGGVYVSPLNIGAPIDEHFISEGECDCNGFHVFAVSDGMGGHSFGEVASKIAVEQLCDFEKSNEGMPVDNNNDKYNLIQNFQKRIQLINHEILTYADVKNASDGIGATLTGLIVFPDIFVSFNIGDSSVFLLENGQLIKITKDHNEAQMMLDAGVYTPEELKAIGRGKKLTKYLGWPDENGILTANITAPLELKKGQRFLLCSDGLTDEATPENVKAAMALNVDDHSVAEKLLETVLCIASESKNGLDNITIIAITVDETIE